MENISLVASIQKKLDDIQQYGNEPIMLEGPIGAGKTTIVECLAHVLHKTLVKVQLGEDSDSKSILGTYCCGKIPGLFYWRNSALIEAMLKGHWILLEDFDQASADVYGVLMPLLESGSLLVPELGNEIVRAKEGFRLFATSRLIETSDGFTRIKINPQFESTAKFFTRITVEPMHVEELFQVIGQISKIKNDDVKILVNIYQELTKIYKNKLNFTMRNLIKCCKRISRFSDKMRSNSLIALEAFDVFGGAIQSKADQQKMKDMIAKLIDDSKRVCIRISDSLIQVGQHELKIHSKISGYAQRKTPKLRFNVDTYYLLESIAGCMLVNKPILLVGEMNKIDFIQFFSDNMNTKLKVLNFSESFIPTLPGMCDPIGYESTHAQMINLMKKFKKVSNSRALNKKYKKLVRKMEECCAMSRFTEMIDRMKDMIPNMISMYKEGHKTYKQWMDITDDIKQAEASLNRNPLFAVIEENVVMAIKNGEWLILDDIDLVDVEILNSISALLETKSDSINLAIRGKLPAIARHANFRIFACLSSAQEKEISKLPSDLRNCFNEFHLTELTKFIYGDFESTASLFRARKVLVNEIELIVEFRQNSPRQSQPKVDENKIYIGRYELERFCGPNVITTTPKIAYTSQSVCLLENIAGCILNSEPLLLVGETGTGKTSAVQYLAKLMNANLRVVNMNQQSESSDLLGAYRPVSVKEIVSDNKGPVFSFIEGTLVKAMRNGDWILLDEINLADNDILEYLCGLLESEKGSVTLASTGGHEPVVTHKNFRIFGCMNPGHDFGKKELPLSLRNRFTEFFVNEASSYDDLRILVQHYLPNIDDNITDGIVSFYTKIRNTSDLCDGVGKKPLFGMRTLCRALRIAKELTYGEINRSIYEGFSVSFLTQLNSVSYSVMEAIIREDILQNVVIKDVPNLKDGFVVCQGYQIAKGTLVPQIDPKYIITPSVKKNLRDLARAIAARRLPVLIQGETSVGKTSMITYLARATGNICYRINNHEYTDVQEYTGTYTSDSNGQLVFKEGALVEAMRKGYWIILDELNLAPSEVLEALNRLLDDNRELFLPETQEVVKAHEKFLIFATQNPPGRYGGRKELSKAFQNRFLELHFHPIPQDDLVTILAKKTGISKVLSKEMVEVMCELQNIRDNSNTFSNTEDLVTMRELFRWAERFMKAKETDSNKDDYEILAEQGYLLLVGKVRKDSHKEWIRHAIIKRLGMEINEEKLFEMSICASPAGFEQVVMTKAMKRIAVLVSEALTHKEPVLLVGETGCGKTTATQMFAKLKNVDLLTLNCHLHTETSDFLGGLRPVRNKKENCKSLFEWCDGPLIKAMKNGSVFLVDEISLAEDSVLERLNSVLEPERKLLLVECGGNNESDGSIQIDAVDSFRIVGTMNPGGDYGKKELSPALRNRFTEIWCSQSSEKEDLAKIVEHNLKNGLFKDIIADKMVTFLMWMKKHELTSTVASIRDLLSWVSFINATAESNNKEGRNDDLTSFLKPELAYIHGALMVFVDALQPDQIQAKDVMLHYLCNQVQYDKDEIESTLRSNFVVNSDSKFFQMSSFKIPRGPSVDHHAFEFAFGAPTTSSNAVRVMRALQLHRPILLEGSPGVGKTSLVMALAKASGNSIVRINLSDQTEISDLFGADLPKNGGKCGEFKWVDGPLLAGLKAGHWIVLDELNLATQSVLEGLNACLDHRAEVFIPEISQTFKIDHKRTRIFACQNPLNEGGDRKGLPKSFLNRFTQVYLDQLTFDDLFFILKTVHPEFSEKTLTRMVTFNMRIHQSMNQSNRICVLDFNLRDMMRWCQLCKINNDIQNPCRYIDVIYMMRLRTVNDRREAEVIFKEVFQEDYSLYIPSSAHLVTDSLVQVGHSLLRRHHENNSSVPTDNEHPLRFIQSNNRAFSSLIECVNMKWLAIMVGPSGCGKTSLLKMVSRLTGNLLHTMPMNSSMDTSELLGSFEQASFRRKIETFIQHWSVVVEKINHECGQQLEELWAEFVNSQKAITLQKEEIGTSEIGVEILERIKDALISINKQIGAKTYPSDFEEAVSSMQESCSKLECGQFQWVESLLLTCMRKGWWIVLDNINFCSASVLDRLNGVLEPNGVLTLDELGAGDDGKIPEITPHPNFRIFVTMDPIKGEISRAMRNRGIEICMMPITVNDSSSLEDLTGLIHDSGLNPTVIQKVLHFYREAKSQGLTLDVGSLIRACRLTKMGMNSKINKNEVQSMKNAFLLTYVDGCHDIESKKKFYALINSMIESQNSSHPMISLPLPSVNEYLQNVDMASVGKVSVQLKRNMHSTIARSRINIVTTVALQSSSVNALKLLPSNLKHHLNDGKSENNMNSRQTGEKIIKFLSSLSDHKLVNLFIETLGNSPDKYQLPMNVYRSSALVRLGGLSETAVRTLRNIYKQIPLITKCEIMASDLKDAITAAESSGTHSAETNSLIQWTKHNCIGTAQSNSISQLVLYIKLAADNLKEASKVLLDWDDESIGQVSEGMTWLSKLVSCLGSKISSNKVNESLTRAWLFATWANVRLEKMFQNSFSSQLSNVIEALNESHVCSKQIDKFHMAAMNLYGWPNGCKNESEANLCLKAKALLNSYFVVEDNILNNINLADTSKLLRFLSNESVNTIKQQLMNFLVDPSLTTDLNHEMIENERLHIYGDDSLHYDFSTSFQLIPIRSYFLSCHSGVLLQMMLRHSLPNADHLKLLEDITSRTFSTNNFYSLAGCKYYSLLGKPSYSFLFQLISSHLDSSKTNRLTMALSNLIGNLEFHDIGKIQDCVKLQESKSNLLSGFSNAVIRIIRNGLSFKRDDKASASNKSWLLSSIQLKHATRKLCLARSLEGYLWSYLANQELNNWDNMSNNLMILEHCIDIVATLMNHLLPMLVESGSLFEKVFSMAKDYLGKAKIEASSQSKFCSVGKSLGMAWLCLGQLQFMMLCPKQGSLDSLEMARAESDGLCEMVRDIKEEINIRNTHAFLYGENKRDDDIERLKLHLLTLEEKLKGCPHLYRPTPSQYPELCKEISEFSNELFTSEKLINAAQNVILAFELCQNSPQQSDFARLSPLLNGLQNMLAHLSQFMKTFENSYYLYHNLRTNLMSALKQCKFGIDTLVLSVETEMDRMELSRDISVDVDQLASSLIAFPTASLNQVNVYEMVDLFLSEDFQTLLKRIENKSGIDLINRILKACSMLLLNSSKMSPNHPKLFSQLNRLATIYHSRWVEEEEEKESRRKNDQCRMDFSVLSFNNKFTQSMKLNRPYKWKSIHFISYEDFKFFVSVYFQIMGKERLDDTENANSELEVDWFPYCNFIHQLTSEIFKDMAHLLNPKIERMLVAHHLLSLCLIQSSLEGKKTSKSQENVNINIVECQKVLEDVMVQLELKLVQIPDNPTLIELKNYINCLLTYPVASPAMKFVLGLHTIVRNTQTLGNKLCRSLKLDKLFYLVKRWRVVEISAWKSFMTSLEMKHETNLWKRFFGILGHIKYCIEEMPRIEETQVLEAVTMSSKIGDFQPELKMLLSIYHYLKHLSNNVSENNRHCKESIEKLATIFRNAHDMNSLYLPYVENIVSASRNKMEDNVERMKISKFSEINKVMNDSCTSYRQVLNDDCHKDFGFFRIAALTNDELVDEQALSFTSCLNSNIVKVELELCKSENLKKIISCSADIIDQIDLKDSIINLELLNGKLIKIIKSAVEDDNKSVDNFNERLSESLEHLKTLGVDHIKAFKLNSTTSNENMKELLLSLYQANPIPKCISGEDESDDFLAIQLRECSKNVQISLAERTHYLISHESQSNESQHETQEEEYSSLVDNLRNCVADNLTNVQQLKMHLIDINNITSNESLTDQAMTNAWKAKAEELHLLLVEYLHQLRYVVNTVTLNSTVGVYENQDDKAFTSLMVESNLDLNKDDYLSVKVIIKECLGELHCENIPTFNCKEGVAVVKLSWVECLFEKLKNVLKMLRLIEDKLSLVKDIVKRINKSTISAQPLIELIETNLDGFEKFRKATFNGRTELTEADNSYQLTILKTSCQSLANFCLKRLEQVLAITIAQGEDGGRQLIPNLGSRLQMILKTLDVTEVNNHLSLIISIMCTLSSQKKSSKCMVLAMHSLTDITGTLKQYAKLLDFITILQVSALKEMAKLEALMLICLEMSTKHDKNGFDSSITLETSNPVSKGGITNIRSSQAKEPIPNDDTGADKTNTAEVKKSSTDNEISDTENAANNSRDEDGSIGKRNSQKNDTTVEPSNSNDERFSSDSRNKDLSADVKSKDGAKGSQSFSTDSESSETKNAANNSRDEDGSIEKRNSQKNDTTVEPSNSNDERVSSNGRNKDSSLEVKNKDGAKRPQSCSTDSESSDTKNAASNSNDEDCSTEKRNSQKHDTTAELRISNDEKISFDITNKDSSPEVKNKDGVHVSEKIQHENELDKYDQLTGKENDIYNYLLKDCTGKTYTDEYLEWLIKVVQSSIGDWNKYTKKTTYMTEKLRNELRIIFCPNQANKMKGGYKTGKRIDMKKVIQYIASDFRKDRIWLKRTKPCQRNYQIILGIDDSGSMTVTRVGELALQSVAIVMNALTQVGIKDVGICSFGKTVDVLHPLGKPFSDQCGNEILKKLTLSQNASSTYLVSNMIDTSMSMFAEHRSVCTSSSSVPNKILLMFTDGVMSNSVQYHEAFERAAAADIFVAAVILGSNSAFKKREEKRCNGLLQFPYSFEIKHADQLPQAMVESLRQWFEYTY